jgi:hypothetical protein
MPQKRWTFGQHFRHHHSDAIDHSPSPSRPSARRCGARRMTGTCAAAANSARTSDCRARKLDIGGHVAGFGVEIPDEPILNYC